MTTLHTVVIYNPGSGDGGLDVQVLELGTQPGFEIWHVENEESPLHLATKARSMGAQRVVAAGGDGTVNAVINGLLAAGPDGAPALGVLPCGSANDFSKVLGFGPDWEQAAQALASGQTRKVDVVKVTGGKVGWLINAATGGLSVDINEQMDEETKRWWGGYAYARTALEVVPQAPEYDVVVEADDDVYRGPSSAVICANGSHAGGASLVPPADPHDGFLDLVMTLPTTLAERVGVFADFALGRHLDSPFIRYSRVRRVRIESDPPMAFISDGEMLGETPLTFEVVPAALEVTVLPDPE